jgi:hypothetical protein
MAACMATGNHDHFLFKSFKNQYGRQYATADEENMRFKIFLGNLS